MVKMLLKGFKIQNCKDIHNSGWIEIEDITTIIGNNENRKLNMFKALWAINDLSENKNNNVLYQERCDEGDKVFVSVRYKMSGDVRKDLSERTKIDEQYIKDTIEINKFFSGEYSICNFIKGNKWIADRLNEWVNKSEKKLSKNILKIVRKYSKSIEKKETASNNMIQEEMKSFFEKLKELNTTKKENKIIKKLTDVITSSYVFNQDNQDIKSIVIQNMPQFILCEECDSTDKLSVNEEKLSLDEFYARVRDCFYEKGDKGIILLMHNFEKNCTLKTDLDFIDYYKEKFNDIQCIHTTAAPFLLNETNKDRHIINSDRKFRKEVCVKQEQSSTKFLIAMGVGVFIWIYFTVELFVKSFQNIDINFSEQSWMMSIEQIWEIIHGIGIAQGKFLGVILVLIVTYLFLRDKVEKYINKHILSEFLPGLLTGPMILPITIFCNLFPILLGIIIIMSAVLGTFFASLIIFPYITEKFIFLLDFSLDFINNAGVEIKVSKILLSNDQLNIYMISIIALALLPYINEVVIRIISFIFGFSNKQVTDTATKLIRKILNVNSIRAVIYILTFILSMITLILEFEDTIYIKVIKEAMLSFIILDVVSNSIYNYIINLRKRRTKLRRLELLNLLKKTFNDDLKKKDKHEICNILCNMEKDKKLVFYFECDNKYSFLEKWKKKKFISDKEYLKGIFYKYNRLKNITIMLKKDYIALLSDIKESIEYYERVIISS